jgi:2-polyprenyl-3-methyl-5-hydroxy-6-metoxy-1,4-benzoquinol methylase
MKKNRSKKSRSARDAGKSSGEPVYPYSGKDISAFFSRHESVRVAYLKIERSIDDFGHHICEIILNAEGERLFLQGIEFRRNQFRYPTHLQALPSHIRNTLEQQVIHRLLQTRVIESPLTEEALAYSGERIIPGTAPFHAYWMHARRYGFAAKRCRSKRVLDAGCGSGYGTRILGLEATECLGVDRDPESVGLAESLFATARIRFSVADVSRLEGLADETFHVVVALEVLEHLPSESIPAFMAAVRRVLTTDGTLVVSVANRAHQDKEENPFHLSEMLFEEFEELLETWFPSWKIRLYGQDVWRGTWHLERECRIEPIQSETSQHVYLAVVEPERSEGRKP